MGRANALVNILKANCPCDDVPLRRDVLGSLSLRLKSDDNGGISC